MEATNYTPEEFAALAVNDTAAWVEAFRTRPGENGEDDDDPENLAYLADLDAMHGLDVFEVYSEGGHEGGGDHAEVVFAVAPEGSKEVDGRVPGALVYFRITGFYSSHEGTEWDDGITVVEPRDVMVVQYFGPGEK